MPETKFASTEKLQEISKAACASVLADVTTYDHNQTLVWNQNIINKILQDTLTAITPAGKDAQPGYKFAVNSTIVQHAAVPSGGDVKSAGRRGMHSATGAYWNAEQDGMWSYKYEGGDKTNLDVVISIFWFAV